jgi:thymidylate synthase (FAD)
MRIIDPAFEILDRLDEEPMAVRLEACGRVCYKSEEKITEESAIPFVKKIAAHGHNSVLEMATATYRVICHPDHVLEFFCLSTPVYHYGSNRVRFTADRFHQGLQGDLRKIC